jgi:methionine-rich copper-binding protein CopC
MKQLALAASALVALAGTAFAHAHLQRAAPPVGGTVRKAPERVELWFSERLEPSLSRLEVQDASGQRVDKNDAHAAPDDARHLVASVPSLAPGKYKVVWRAVSVDSHVTEGDFTFTIAP